MADGEALARTCPADEPTVADGPAPLVATDPALAAELRRFVLGVTRDPDLADDVMQATYVKALERGHEARPETARGWLFRVAFHEALAARRRAEARDRGHRKLSDLGLRDQPAPEEPLIRRESAAAVREALGALPEAQRLVVLARIYQDKTFAQIARESGLPLGTVLTRMRRALHALRKTLTPGA